MLSPTGVVLLIPLPACPLTSDKVDEKVGGNSICQPTSLFLLLVPNLISLKFPLKVQMGGCRIQKLSKLQFSESRPGKALTFSIACSWICLPPPLVSGQFGYVKDPWEIHMQRQEPLEGKLWEQGTWLMKCHVWKPSGSSKLALSNTSYELNVKNAEQNLYLAVEGCLRARTLKVHQYLLKMFQTGIQA